MFKNDTSLKKKWKNGRLKKNTLKTFFPTMVNLGLTVCKILLKETINATLALVQQFNKSKKATNVTLKSKIFDLSMSISSTKVKLKKFINENQNQGGTELWTLGVPIISHLHITT